MSIFIATPASWYLMHIWLQNYEYRIFMQWWMFLLSGIIALVIAMITICYQAIKVAVANPVKSLRIE